MPAGTVIVPQPVSPVAKSAASSCEFALIGRRAIWPMTWLGSPNAVAFRLATSRVWVVTMSAVTVTPRLMSRVAITVGSVVGGAVRRVLGTAAAQEQRDSHERDDRQKYPDEQDKPIRALQVQVSPSRVTGGTTLAFGFGRATIPMG